VSNAYGRGASFSIPPGGSYRCLLDNRVTNPGFLTINKRAVDVNGTEVFTAQDFPMSVNPIVGSFSIDTSGGDDDRVLFEEYTRTRRMALPAGTYRFVENPTADFLLQEMTCTGGAFTLLNGPGRINGADITVAAGANVVCELTNAPGSNTTLRIRKNTLTTGGRLFQDPTRFTFNAPNESFQLASLAGSGASSERLLSIPANRTVRITEDQIAGWRLTDITCSSGVVTPVRNAGNDLIGLDIVVAVNETPTCSFSNSGDQTRLTVVKATERAGTAAASTQPFTFRGDQGTFTLDTSGTTSTPAEVSFARGAGAVTILEDALAGWTLDRITCIESSGRAVTTAAAASGTSSGVTVTMIAGDQVRFTFVNAEGDTPPPPNRAPLCADRIATVVAGASVDVAPSCSDPDGDAVAVSLGTVAPTKGTVSIVAGQLRYSAAAGASGTDSFTYVGTDARAMASAPATVTVTITSPPPSRPELSVANASVTEGTGPGTTTLRFVLRLSSPAPSTGATVVVATAPGAATSPADYGQLSRTVTFAAGEQEAAVDVDVVRDALDETDETFELRFTDPDGLTLAAASAVGTIVDDDEPALQTGTMRVVLDAVPDDGQDVTFSGSGSIGTFSLDDDADAVLPRERAFTVPAGPVTVMQAAVPTGWTFTGATCVGATAAVDVAARSTTVTVSAAATVTCTFTNTKDAPPPPPPPPPPPVPDCPGGDVVADFRRFKVGNSPGYPFRTPSVAVTLPAGRYELTLVGADRNHRAGFQAEQRDERYVLELLDASGNVVLTTGSTADLAETATITTQVVGVYDVPGGVVAVRARHVLVSASGQHTVADINSVEVVCASFRGRTSG
jgi:hypothetical protein